MANEVRAEARPNGSPPRSATLLAVLAANRVVQGSRPPLFRHGRGLTEDERTRLAADRAAISAWLVPVEADEIGPLVMPIITTMQAREAGQLAPMRAAAYLVALEALPRAAIGEACRRVLRGEADGLSDIYAPTPPQLASLARAIGQDANGQAWMIGHLLDAPEERPPAPREAREASVVNLGGFLARGRAAQAAVDEILQRETGGTVLDRAAEARARAERVTARLAEMNLPPPPSAAGSSQARLTEVEDETGERENWHDKP